MLRSSVNDISKMVWKPCEDFHIEAEHKCSEFCRALSKDIFDNMVIVKYSKRWYWVFDIYADELTVNDGEAEKVWDYIKGYGFIIFCCPYCGEELV